jgi:hypothetical protein
MAMTLDNVRCDIGDNKVHLIGDLALESNKTEFVTSINKGW